MVSPLKPTRRTSGFRFRQIVIVAYCFSVTAGRPSNSQGSSSNSRSSSTNSWRRNASERRSTMYSWSDDYDDMTSHDASATDDEERILSAIASLDDNGGGKSTTNHYRPKARGLMPRPVTLDDLRDDEEGDDDNVSAVVPDARRRKHRVVKKRRTTVVTTPSSNREDELQDPVVVKRSTTTKRLPSLPTSNQTDRRRRPVNEPNRDLWNRYSPRRGPLETVTESSPPASSQRQPRQANSSSVRRIPNVSHPNPLPPSSLGILSQSPPGSGIVQEQHTIRPRSINNNNNNGGGNPPPVPASAPVTSSTTFWVRRYLNSRPKDVLLPVPKEYIADGFNLAQLAPIVERIGFQFMGTQAVEVAKRLMELPSSSPTSSTPQQPSSSFPIYRLALQLLLCENEDEEASILTHPLISPHAIQHAAEALYLIVHARFVTSPRGLDALRRILLSSPVFGKCPRPQCQGTMLLPYGASNDYTSNSHTCQRYCPCCGNLWNCWESKTDGCAWGPSLCFLLLMAHGHELFPSASSSQPISSERLSHPNDPRVFGFRIHPAASWGHPLSTPS